MIRTAHMSPSRTPRRSRAVAALVSMTTTAVAVATVGVVSAAPAQGAERRASIPIAASGAAMGSRITGNAVVGSGRSAASYLCTADFPRRSSNDVVGTRGATEGVLELGAVTTRMRALKIKGSKASRSYAAAAEIVLGDGQVRIEGITSFSQVVERPRGFGLRSNVTVGALTIAGQRFPLELGTDEQTIPIPGFGTLTFNEVRRVNRANKGIVRTSALTARLTDGTVIQLVRSKARLDRTPDGVFRGGAWGSEVDVADLAGSGRTALQPMPCAGTRGRRNVNDTATAKLPSLVTAAVQRSIVRTRTYRNGNGEGVAFSRVADVNVGGGQLAISGLRARALIVRAPGGRVVRSKPSSTIGTLTAGGQTFEAPDPGQSLEIPGVASVTAGVVEENRRGLKVVALRVSLLDGSGAVVDLGVAKVFARR